MQRFNIRESSKTFHKGEKVAKLILEKTVAIEKGTGNKKWLSLIISIVLGA